MQNNLAISVQDVTKVYRLYDKPIDRLKEALSPTHKEYHKKFFALDKISFDVEKGTTVGIIGTNGSGKSTILKIITGVLSPMEIFLHCLNLEQALIWIIQALKMYI